MRKRKTEIAAAKNALAMTIIVMELAKSFWNAYVTEKHGIGYYIVIARVFFAAAISSLSMYIVWTKAVNANSYVLAISR